MYAITYNSLLAYIGKADDAPFTMEARNRQNKWAKCLIEQGELPKDWGHYNADRKFEVTDQRARDYVNEHCKAFVAVMENAPQGRIKNTEEYMIFKLGKKRLRFNKQFKKRFDLEGNFSVKNTGDLPQGLDEDIPLQ